MLIRFDRIGRDTSPARMVLEVPPGIEGIESAIEHLVHQHALPSLVSREVYVRVDLRAATVWLEGGRYGRGTIEC